MSQNWQTYPEITALLDPTTDDVMVRDVSNTSANATGTNGRLLLNAVLGLSGSTPGGRLTTESGVPVSMSDRTAQGTIYYTPHAHDFVRLWDGTRPKLYQFTERSLAITATSGKNYDYFIYDNAGTLTLEPSAAWTNDTTRADALAWQAGVGWVKSGTATRLWLGTIRASGTNTTEQSFATTDAPVKQFVWNAYNRVRVGLRNFDSADTWTYTTATWRQKRGSANNQIEVVCGLSGSSCLSLVNSMFSSNTGGNTRRISIGVNATNAIDACATSAGTQVSSGIVAALNRSMALGYSYAAAIEWSVASGTSTWYGDGGDSSIVAEAFGGTWEM